MFTIIIVEKTTPPRATSPDAVQPAFTLDVERYRQTVDTLDINEVIKAVNPQQRRKRRDAGQKRTPRT